MATNLRLRLFTPIEASDVPLCTESRQDKCCGYYREISGLWDISSAGGASCQRPVTSICANNRQLTGPELAPQQLSWPTCRPTRPATSCGRSRLPGEEETMTAAPRGDASILFATPRTVAEHRADGSIVLRSPEPLRDGARCIGDWLEQWARQRPDTVFLAERDSADTPWAIMTYAGALRRVRAAASWILAQGLGAERPLVILSDNSIDHALLALAAQHVGVPSAAISPAYSLMSKDFDKLRSMISLLEPGAIYVSATRPFAAALAAIKALHSAQIISGNAGDADAIPFRAIAATPETPDVERAFAALTPDTIAKFLFTSGSTGTPKAVINTQRMLTSSQQAKAQTWSFLGGTPLTILDWLPWSHTFGANHNFNLV